MFQVHGKQIYAGSKSTHDRSTCGHYYGNIISVSKKSGGFPKGLVFLKDGLVKYDVSARSLFVVSTFRSIFPCMLRTKINCPSKHNSELRVMVRVN